MKNKLWQIVGAAAGMSGGHDLSHVRRVYRLAMRLSDFYPEVDRELLTAAVILHDIARREEDDDASGIVDHAMLGAEKAEQILLELGWDAERASAVAACVRCHRYRGEENAPRTIEAKILYDADKLDCLGAVGVGRLFMLSGQYGERLYIEPPAGFGRDGHAPRISEFAEYSPNLEYLLKMRHIPEKLFTQAARDIAAVRMARMDRFFEELKEEIEG